MTPLKKSVLLRRLTSCVCFFLAATVLMTSSPVNAQDDKSQCIPDPHDIPNLAPDPDPQAPDKFLVEWTTTVSTEKIVLEVVREWSPLGVDRFYQLLLDDYYTCAAFFRVVPDFVVQFGIAAQPNETLKWNTTIPDDPVLQSNLFGFVSYATAGPDTRTSQIFINLNNNSRLDAEGFSPFGRVVEGMGVVEEIYNPTPNDSGGIDQDNYTAFGNPWILENYPNITLISSTKVKVDQDDTSAATAGMHWSNVVSLVMTMTIGWLLLSSTMLWHN